MALPKKTSYLMGGTFNISVPTLSDGDLSPFQLDASGNLKVNVVAGGGSGSNAAAGPTGSPVPADASYTGVNVSGNLVGVTGFSLTNATPAAVAIVDGNGNQIVSFGGGTQYATGTAVATPTGTAALGWDGADVRVLSTDASGQLKVLIQNTPAVTVSGNVNVTQGTSPWVDDPIDRAGRLLGIVYGSQSKQLTQTATNFNLQVELATGATLYDARQIRALTSADVVTVDQGTSPWVISFTAPQHVIVDSGSVSITGTVGVTQSTSPWIVAGAKTPADAFANPTDAEDTFALLGGWDATAGKWQRVQVDAGTGILKVDIGSNGTVAVSGNVNVTQGTSPWVISFTAPQHVIVDSGSLSVIQGTNPWVISFTAPQHIIIDSGTTAVTQGTNPWTVAGNLTNNNAAPGATNVGVLPAVANTQAPSNTTGDQVLLSTDLSGNLRVANQATQKIVQKTSNSSSGSVASLAKAFVSDNIAGNSIVVVCGIGNSGAGTTVTDTQGNSYTSVLNAINGTAFSVLIFLATGIAAGANTVTVNNGGAAASIAMEIYEVSGILVSGYTYPDLDGTAFATGTSAFPSAFFNSVGGNELIFSGVGVGTAAQTITPQPGVGWTNDSGQLNPVTPSGLFSFISMSNYVVQSSAKQYNIAPTLAGSEPWALAAVSFFSYNQPVSGVLAARVYGNDGHTIDAAINTGTPGAAIWGTPAPTTQSAASLTPKYINATTAANLKASAGNLYGLFLLNLADTTTTTVAEVMYVHFFDTSNATLSTVNWKFALPLPAGTQGTVGGTGTGNPLSIPPGAFALGNFVNGISIVINTTSTSNTTAAGTAPTGVIWIE